MVDHPSDTQTELDALLQRMSPAIADVLARLMAVDNLSWPVARQFRDEIVELNQSAQTDEEQTALLFAFVSLMDGVEQRELIEPESIPDFRRVRKADYLMMLNVQAMVGGLVLPERLEYVTRREVEAGRLDPDDEFRRFAIASINVPVTLADNPPPKNWIRKLFSRRR